MTSRSWNLVGSAHVAVFRVPLERVAKLLKVSNQFNSKLICAELVDDWGVIARVNVYGKDGLPATAKVTSKNQLQLVAKAALKEALAPLPVTFEVVE
ncbi:MAG: hypothetical protein NTV60_00175 [Candidatus Kaiserbacteria bacterium]|nr:hypothetical protein [Candidatus Kaiserbacteria bacterium]